MTEKEESQIDFQFFARFTRASLFCFVTNGQLQTDKMDTHAGIQNETAETTYVETMNMQL